MKKVTIPLTILLVASIAFWVNRYLTVDPLIETREQITKAEAERTGSQSQTTPASGNQEQPTSKSVAQESNQPEAKPATFEPEGTVPRILETLTQATVNRIETQTVPGKEADTPDIRRSLIETSMKHPFVIVEEKGRFFGQPEESVESVRAKVATHFMLQVRPGTNLVQLQEKLTALDCSIGEKLVDNNFIVTLKGELSIEKHFVIRQAIEEIQEFVEVVEPDYIVYAIGTPNDTMMINLWGMHNAGQAGGTDDKDIDAPEAWDLQTGNHNVLVGVIDTGIDRTHIDLAANMWTNPSEIPGNGIDDDGNGFIDDVHGWDFYSDDNDPQDGDSHGTHCAGTIGAVGNNANGVVGVCWDVSMVGIRFLGPFGGYTSDAVKSIDYATRIGVDLTSNSWGGGGYSSSVKSAIDEAGLEGIGFVAAAGNDAYDNDVYPSYPASYASENIISVGAHNDNGNSAWFSQWGQTSVDLFAPGTDILSTVPGNQYASYDGTSMATPHVAGAYALLLASNPDWTVLEAKNTLMNATDFEDSLTNKCVTGGRLNVFKALSGESSEENLITVNPVNIDFGNVSINQSAEFEFILSNPGNTPTIVTEAFIEGTNEYSQHLMGQWKFDGNTEDSSSNQNHGTAFGAEFVEDRLGRPNSALYFDGVDDKVVVPHHESLNPTDQLTMTLWAKAEEYTTIWGPIIHKGGLREGQWRNREFALFANRDNYFHFCSAGKDANQVAYNLYEVGEEYGNWIHYGASLDRVNGKIHLFLNGEKMVEESDPYENFNNNEFDMLIGSRAAGDDFFCGWVDDFRLYATSLTEDEIKAIYEGQDFSSPFSVALETPLTLEPYSSQIGKIKFSSDQEGIHQANLIVESNAQNQPELEIPLTAEVMSTPILEVDQESMHFALLEGQSKTQTLTLSNLGDGELNYQIFITTDESESPTTSTLWAMGTNDYGQLGDGSYEHRVLPVMIEESEILDIAASHNHTLMLKQGGSLWAMGDNSGGQLGDGTWEGKTTPVMVVDQGVVAIAAGGTWSGHSLFVKEDGSLWVMGDNSNGQLGDGSGTNRNAPVQIEESGVVGVSAGWYNSIYLKEDGSIWAMGENYFGEDTGDRYLPEKVVESGAVKIYSGCYHAHFLKEDGSLWAMGSNWYGQLGDGTFEDRRSPVEVASGVSEMVAGNTHTLFLKEDGSLWAMGSNSDGELGDGSGESQSTPVMIESAGVVNLGAEEWWSAYVKEDGSLWAIGSNTYGGGNQNRMVPEKLVDGGVSDLALGWGYCLFTKGSQGPADKGLWATGYNESGQLGDGTNEDKNTFTQIIESGVKEISAGGGHSLILKEDGSLWATGYNNFGHLGDGTNEDRNTYTQIIESGVKEIYATGSSSHILKEDGSLWATGYNYLGQLGDGTNENRNTFTQIIESGVKEISARGHSLILKEDGSLWATGQNNLGQLGDGTNENKNTFTQIIESGVKEISATYSHSLILKEDGSLWGTGGNYLGQLGDGTYENRNTFTQIIESGVREIFAVNNHSLILKEDGSLWATGYNNFGQLGDGTNENKNTFTQIIESGVKEISATYSHSLILKEDGSLWGTGRNEWGQLGDGTNEDRNTFTQIIESGVREIYATNSSSHILKEDGSLWATGINYLGQLGDGTNEDKNTFTQIIESGVKEISTRGFNSLVLKSEQNNQQPIWLSIDQNQGSIDPSENNQIQVTADASLLPADFATAYLRIESNDPSEPVQTVTVTANLLQEGEGLIFNPGEVSFDQTYVGQASEMEVTLLNGGTDPLTITNFVFYDSAFSHHLNLPMVMQAGDLVTTTLYFEPDSAGLIESNGLVLTNEEGQTSYQLPVSGSAVFAPSLAFSPGQVSESLEMNQEKTVSFTLTNNGGSPLQWSLKGATTPCVLGTGNACSTACNHGIGASWYKSGKIFGMEHFAPLTKGGIDRRSGSPISKMGGGPDFHGYSWTDSKDPAGPEYNWEDISTDGELLTELSQSDDGYSEVALPFTMSLYGEEFDRVYVSSNGYLTFGSPSTDHAHFPLPSTMMPGNLVAPLAMDLNPANGGEIYVLKDQEKIIVQYEKVKDFAGLGEYTFQTVLYRNGVIFFNYKEMASALATTGIQNASGDVGLLVAYNNEQIQSEMTVRVSTSPKWLHVSQSSGTLSAGQSQTIDLILKAGKIQHGTYESEMELSTNDPDNLKVKVPVALTVEATQILAASPVALDFGEVEVGLSNTLGLTLTNEGNAPVSLSGLTANDAAFSTNFSAGTINPGASKTLSVSFQPSSGMTYDSVCSLLSDAENSPLDVPLSGIGLASPKLRINPESLQITVEAGQQASETAVLDNHEGQAEGTYALREIRSGQAAQALTGFNGNAGQVSEFIPEDPFQAEHLADELIVVFKANVDGFANQVNQTEGIVQVRPLGIAKTPGSGAQALSGGSIALVRNETDLSLRELAQQLSEDDGVAYVEPNYIVRHTSLPNDPEYGEQWALPKIQAPEAWDMAKGDASVIVAVIDTGIDYNHPDLQGNLWTNPGEIAGNGIDDDGNGYIDDVRGWDFYNQDNDPMDGDSHGTHVAGTIAASTNNGQLVSGVSWHAGLVGLKFLSDDGWGNTADAIDAVAYCAAMDFPISNNSWGGGGYSQALKDVIAQAGEMGHLFCAAAGNSASDNDVSPHYPSNYDLPSILSIAASNDLDQLAWFSCYGNLTVDMAAPGENILSLIPNGGTASYSGTSMATPHVAGAAALLLSIDPDSGYQKLKNLLMNSVDPIPAFEGKMVAAGRLNLANAVIETSPSWLTVAPESGSVAAGGQTNLVFSADAANFNAGTRNAIAVFETNDPLAPTLEVPVELTITGAPRIVVSQTALDFGTVWTGQSASLGLQVSNLGTDALEVSSIASDDVVFSADQTSLSLNPGQSAQLQITAQPEASSEVTATLTLDSNDQENPAVEVALQVNGILPPSLSVAPTSVSLSLEKDETGEKQLTITNTGEATGEWDAYLIETGASTSNKMNLLNALASIEARVEIPDFRSPRLSMLSAAEVATLEEPEPVVRIEANPNSQLEVAVLGAAFDYENEDIANGLVATEAFGGVTMINVSWVTPTLSELSVFDAILVYSIDPYWDAEALGNVVADYALAGGGVVTASHEGNTHSLAGKWVEEALNLYDIEDNYLAVEETMGDALIPGHPVLLNVESFAGNSLHVRGNPNANAMVVANWSNGTPLVTVREGLTLVADLSFWPVSDQADGLGYFPGWDSSTDGWQLMANCLTWTTNGSAPDWLSADILSGSVLGNSESEMTLLFDATDLPVGNYTAEAHFVTNDPVQAYSRVEVLLVVTENQPPVASSTTLSLLEDQSVSFVLSATDPDGDELSYEILSQPAHGTLTGDAPDLTYVPGTNFNGEDSLTFRVSDGSLSSESAKVTFIVEAVNDAPWAGSQDLNGTEDEFLFLSFDYGDPDGDAVELIITQYPEHGFIWEQNEMMMYFPDNHYHGEDLILFGVNDGSLSSEEASIRINLEPANDAPVAEDLAFETNENQALVFELQATDVDGDEMSFEIISQPQHGELIHLGGVSWQYLPFDQFSGTDSLTYRASDSLIQGNLATVSIVVLEQNDPPVVQASTFTMQEDGEVAIKLIASDPEGDELTFEVIEAPTNGVLAGDGPSYDYYPNTNFNGEDSFTVRANDGELDSEDTLITLIINPENDAPSFAQSTQSTQEGLRETPYRMAILVEDPDNDELTVSLSRDPANGSCYFENEELVYLPQPGFAGVENLMLEVTDGIEVTQATFSVNIMAHDNPVPIAFEGEIDTDLIDMLYQANELLSKTGGRIFELCSNSGDAQVTARMTEEIGEDEAMSMEQWLIDGTALEDVVQFDFVAQEGESGLNWFVAPSLTPVFSADADMDNEGTNITGAPVQENQEELIIEEQPVEETDNESNPIADLEDASLADEAEASSPEADADQPQPAPTEVSSQESEVVEPEAPIHQEEEAIVLVPVTPISDPSETLIDPTTGTESEATVSYDSGTDAEANAGTEASQPATVAEENVPQPEVIVTEESNPQPLPTEESGVTETVVAMIGEDDTLAYIADAPESEASETFIDPTTGTESEATVSHDSGTDAQANAGTEANQPAKVAEENVPQPEVIATKEKANEQNSEDEKVAEVEEVVGAVAPVEKTKEQGPLPTEKAVETEAAPEKEHTSKTNDTGEGILDSKTEKSSKPKTETETDPTKEEEIELSEAIEEETEAPTADESKEDSSESEKEETTEEPTLAELSFTEELGDHWLKAPGVGIFYDAGNGWIFQPSMGWCYLKVCDSECSFWLYQEDLGWIWFDIQTQGMVYAMSDWCNGWLHYTAATFSESTFLYDYENEIWMKW